MGTFNRKCYCFIQLYEAAGPVKNTPVINGCSCNSYIHDQNHLKFLNIFCTYLSLSIYIQSFRLSSLMSGLMNECDVIGGYNHMTWETYEWELYEWGQHHCSWGKVKHCLQKMNDVCALAGVRKDPIDPQFFRASTANII